jgi:hypothetical protein
VTSEQNGPSDGDHRQPGTRVSRPGSLRKRGIALAPGLDACPANGAIVAAPVIRARTAHELQGLLSARDRFAAWRNRPMLCREKELMVQVAAGITC